MFQPQAASIQSVQAAVQQVTSQPTQVTNPQVTAAQMAAAQATSAATAVSQSNVSLAALQTAGLSINPAIVRALQGCLFIFVLFFHVGLNVFSSPHILESDQCCFLGSSDAVSQFPHFHSHLHQCHVQHGWHHQSDHHKRAGSGGCHNARSLSSYVTHPNQHDHRRVAEKQDLKVQG